jgi:hypothetical protein
VSDAEVADFVRGERGRLIPKINSEKPAEPKAKLEEELVRTIVLKTAESVQEIVISESIEIVESWRDELLADMSAADRPSFSDLVGDLVRRLEGESNE